MRKITIEDKDKLLIKNITFMVAKKIAKDNKLFSKFISLNKGFVDNCVLTAIGRNKQHPDYEDLYQASSYGLFKSLQKFKRGGSSFSTFAYKVMQNEVRQELKKLNKQKNVIKRKDKLGYDHHEIPLEIIKHKDNQSASHGIGNEYRENLFADTQRMRKMRNFEDNMINDILLEQRTKNFSELELMIYKLHYIEGLSIKKVAKEINKNYATVKEMFYRRMKPKFDEIFKETQSLC